MKKRYIHLLIISLIAVNIIACNKNDETLENIETEQSESGIVMETEIKFIESEVVETEQSEPETSSGLIQQEEVENNPISDEEQAEIDAILEELEKLEDEYEEEQSTTDDGRPFFEGNQDVEQDQSKITF